VRDAGYDSDGLAGLFTEDAVWDGGSFGRFEGREAIRNFFRGIPKLLCFAVHYVMNPLIEVSGEHATGRWYLLESCIFAEGSRAVWGAAHYEDGYAKLSGEWKFRKVKLILVFWTPFEQGWAKKRSVVD